VPCIYAFDDLEVAYIWTIPRLSFPRPLQQSYAAFRVAYSRGLPATAELLVILSVRPSVCLSVTLVDCVHMVRPTIMVSAPYGGPMILVSGGITLIPKFDGVTPSDGVEWGYGVGTNWRFSTFKTLYLQTVQATTKVTIDH